MAFLAVVAGNAFASGLGVAGVAFNWGTFGLLTAEELAQHAFGKSQFVGTRLSDLSVQLAQEGAAIAVGYGSQFSCAGNIIWSTGKVEHDVQVDSGGGSLGPPPATTATYTSSFATLISKVPITRPLKIYLNEHLAYDYGGGGETGYAFTYNSFTKCWSGTSATDNCKIRIYDGTQTMPDSLIEADRGVRKTPAYVGRVYAVFENLDLTPFGNDIPNIRFVFQSSIQSSADIFADICKESGLLTSEIDGSALTQTPFEGFVRTSVGAASSYLGYLSTVLCCDFPVIDGKVTAALREGLSSATFSDDDLRVGLAGKDGNAVSGGSVETGYVRPQERELPERVEVNYISPLRDNTPALRRHIRQDTPSKHVESFSLPMMMEDNEAQLIAEVECWRRVIEARTQTLNVGWEWLYLAPGDRIYLPTNHGLKMHRITSRNAALIGPIALSVCEHSNKIYGQSPPVVTSNVTPPVPAVVETPYTPETFVCDSVAVTDGMAQSPGLLIAAAPGFPVNSGTGNATGQWYGWSARVQNVNTGINLGRAVTGRSQAVIGSTTMNFPLGRTDGYDMGRTLTVHLGPAVLQRSGFESTTLQMSRAGANLLLFETGRYISFLSAVQSSPGVFTLSGIRDGRFGSEWDAPSGIPSGTKVLLVCDAQGVRADQSGKSAWVPLENQYLNQPLRVRVSSGNTGDLLEVVNKTLAGNSMTPLAPAALRLTHDGTGGRTVTGRTRTRLTQSGGWNHAGADMLSDLLRFRVTLFDGTTSVQQFQTSSAIGFSFSWSAADLTALFGSVPAHLTVTVEEVGNTVYFGHPAIVSD